MTQRLPTTLRAFAAAESPTDAAQIVLTDALRSVGASRGRVYLLDLAKASLDSVANVGRSARNSSIPYPRGDQGSGSMQILERAIRTGAVQAEQEIQSDGSPAQRVVVPIMRDRTCLGLLDLDGRDLRMGREDADLGQATRSAVDLTHLLYDWRSRRRLLEESQQPVNFEQSEGDFYDSIMLLTALASQMEFAALREVQEDGSLACIGKIGFPRGVDNGALDLQEVETRFPQFQEVLSTGTAYIAPDLEGFEHAAVKAIPELAPIHSFVAAPVLVGEAVFGVLSFASSIEYAYSTDEVLGLQAVANGIGVSISNFRNFHRAKYEAAEYASAATAITGIEVAQAARHEARGHIDDVVSSVVVLRQQVKSAGSRVSGLVDVIDDIEDSVQGLTQALDKIRAATTPPARERKIVSLREVWDQSRVQLSGRLAAARVDVTYEGPEIEVHVAPDWFRQIFLNLMLNSTDAFGMSAAQKRNRRIRLVVERPTSRVNSFTLTYSDNAGGINAGSLRRTDGEELTLPVEKAIFAQNVTSKDEGSGWGLALVRRQLNDHGGSIDLIEHRGGVTFRIQLPIPTDAERERTERD